MSKVPSHPAVVTVLLTVAGTAFSVIATVAILWATGVQDPTLGIQIAVAVPLLVAPVPTFLLSRANHKLRLLRDELHRIANTDTLTGLPNRRSFFERAAALLARPSGQMLHAVMMIDIDRFKAVNDTFGHAAGDAALQAVAGAIVGSLPETAPNSTLVARLGGEEFAVVIAATSPRSAREFAGGICQAIRGIGLVVDGRALPLTASVGLALCRGPVDTDRALLAADEAVYRAKRAGRDRWVEAAYPPPTEVERKVSPLVAA